MADSIFDLVKQRTVLLDGAMGTELMRHGLALGTCPETWNVEKPDVVRSIHREYLGAGSDVISTNSFGGNRIKLAAHAQESRHDEINNAAARLAREVVPAGKFAAGDIGPTGKFLRPRGEFVEDDFERAFAEQAKALAAGGVDFFLIETMFDLREALCAVRGIRRVSHLPVFVTLTFNRFPRGYFTIMGDSVAKCVDALEKEEAAGFGANCTLNSEEMAGLIAAFREKTSRILIAQANAGQPQIAAEGDLVYTQGIEDYVRFVPKIAAAGANMIGGCCGTTPGFIRRMAEVLWKS